MQRFRGCSADLTGERLCGGRAERRAVHVRALFPRAWRTLHLQPSCRRRRRVDEELVHAQPLRWTDLAQLAEHGLRRLAVRRQVLAAHEQQVRAALLRRLGRHQLGHSGRTCRVVARDDEELLRHSNRPLGRQTEPEHIDLDVEAVEVDVDNAAHVSGGSAELRSAVPSSASAADATSCPAAVRSRFIHCIRPWRFTAFSAVAQASIVCP